MAGHTSLLVSGARPCRPTAEAATRKSEAKTGSILQEWAWVLVAHRMNAEGSVQDGGQSAGKRTEVRGQPKEGGRASKFRWKGSHKDVEWIPNKVFQKTIRGTFECCFALFSSVVLRCFRVFR
jgi:hypothetical protein